MGMQRPVIRLYLVTLSYLVRRGHRARKGREAGEDPVLLLDDVFAELDSGRRERLAAVAADAEQVIVTAAVAQDVPPVLTGARFEVADGSVTRAGGG